MIVYKVVMDLNGNINATEVLPPKYVSVLAYGKARVEYKIGETSVAPEWLAKHGYGLCAFTNHNATKFFGQTDHRTVVLKCRAEGKIRKYENLPLPLSLYDISNGEKSDNLHSLGYTKGWPLDTIMCEKIIPLEEVSR